jgi:hypothetical protein
MAAAHLTRCPCDHPFTAADKAPRRKAGGAAADEDDDDDGAQPAGRGGANKRRKLANGKAKAAAPAAATAAEGDVPQGHQLEEHEAHEEMHDQLHELPFGGDIEIERWVQHVHALLFS